MRLSIFSGGSRGGGVRGLAYRAVQLGRSKRAAASCARHRFDEVTVRQSAPETRLIKRASQQLLTGLLQFAQREMLGKAVERKAHPVDLPTYGGDSPVDEHAMIKREGSKGVCRHPDFS